MDLGHGFLPRVDARNYKAVERCLTRDGPGLWHEGLDLPWAILEGPWAIHAGNSTLMLCRDRGVSTMVDTQAWRYRDARTFLVEKFTSVEHAPPAPLGECDDQTRATFVREDLQAQAALGASAFLLPGVVPTSPRDDVSQETLQLIAEAQAVALTEPRPCFAFIGVHTAALEAAELLIDQLPHWIEGVYIQFTPLTPLQDSPSKIIDCLALLTYARSRGYTVIAGRMANLGALARALGVQAVDSGLGEGESFEYGTKVRSHQTRAQGASPPRPVTGRLYVPQLGRSLSSADWGTLMSVPSLKGHLLCRLPCCAFGQSIESTPSRGREHSLHARVAEAKAAPVGRGAVGLESVVSLLETRQSVGSSLTHALRSADHDPLAVEFIENHLAAARYLRRAVGEVA